MSRPAPGQASLFDWTPPATVAQFDEAHIRAATLNGRVSRAISTALKECSEPRAAIAQRMSAFLGETVSKNMLDAYASQARDDHSITAVRFIALVHATGDRRLLELFAGQFGWAVIDRKYLPLIDLAALQEKQDELRRQSDALRRQARSGGAL